MYCKFSASGVQYNSSNVQVHMCPLCWSIHNTSEVYITMQEQQKCCVCPGQNEAHPRRLPTASLKAV